MLVAMSASVELTIVRRPEERTDRTRWFLHNLATLHVLGDETEGRLGVVEVWGAEGDMPPLHVHGEEDEVFFVLEGRLAVWIGERSATLEAGQSALAPRGVPHAYRVESERARWLAVVAPSRFDGFVAESSAPAEALTLPPETLPLRAPAELAASAARCGIEILAPPGTLPGAAR